MAATGKELPAERLEVLNQVQEQLNFRRMTPEDAEQPGDSERETLLPRQDFPDAEITEVFGTDDENTTKSTTDGAG